MVKVYTLIIEGKFSAAHHLPDYDGPCKRVHGHTWKVVMAFKYVTLTDGMGTDFKVLKNQLDVILNEFDHYDVNQVIENPTAENIAKYSYHMVKIMNKHLAWVEVWESDTVRVRYEPTVEEQSENTTYTPTDGMIG